jgi:hypothetical protein
MGQDERATVEPSGFQLSSEDNREEKIMIAQACRISLSSIVLSMLLLAGLVSAQEKHQFTHSTPPQSSRYVQQHAIDVGDIPGHQIRIVEIQRVYTSDHPLVAGMKVVETWVRGFTDYVNGVGPAEGYATWILEDGNKIFLEWKGSSYSEPTTTGSRRGRSHGTTRLMGGTGRFATIRGVLTDEAEFDPDPRTGYNRVASRGEYWFEK